MAGTNTDLTLGDGNNINLLLTIVIMTTEQQKGYDFAHGAACYLGQLAVWVGLAMALFGLVRNAGGWGLDDSDWDGWTRSGLRVHVDAKTGIEYISDGNGGLVRREPKYPTF